MKPEVYMRIALELAKKGSPSPNPKVGCVIVSNGEIISRGYHKKVGMLHAEVEAILDAKLNLQTLKPKTQNPEHETQGTKSETQDPKLKTQDSSLTGLRANSLEVLGIYSTSSDRRSGHNCTGNGISSTSRRMSQDAIMYLTLEPCSHVWEGKRTPACVDAIIESGIKHVVIAMKDPNPKVSGKGIEKLQGAGVKVDVGVLEKEARELNAAYVKFMEKGLPYIAMKMAMSLDGKTATRTGESKWISCEESRAMVQQLRSWFDSVMVGAETIKRDNPRLVCSIDGAKDPLKIVVDSDLCFDTNANFMKEPKKVIIATTRKASKNKIKKFEALGARIIVCGSEVVDLRALMPELANIGVQSVLLEGGSELNASGLGAGIVDKLYFFIAPVLIGGMEAKGPVGGSGAAKLADALKLKNMKMKKIGMDFLIEADV